MKSDWNTVIRFVVVLTPVTGAATEDARKTTSR